MRRLFWTSIGVGLGATVGVLVARRVRKTREALMPGNLGGAITGAIAGLGETIREFADDVRRGMAEREAELVDALGLDEPGRE